MSSSPKNLKYISKKENLDKDNKLIQRLPKVSRPKVSQVHNSFTKLYDVSVK